MSAVLLGIRTIIVMFLSLVFLVVAFYLSYITIPLLVVGAIGFAYMTYSKY